MIRPLFGLAPLGILSLLFASSLFAQAGRGDVWILWSRLQQGQSSEVYFIGQVANVGAIRADYMRVTYTIKTIHGTVASTNTVVSDPPNLAPGAPGYFRDRAQGLWSIQGHRWSSEVEWSK
ncbi:MAG: hypothetical protein HYV04_18830 [Deltaproteobacteria bacterium]|nr:hypothetical protein [Deltaproteobacteria bacterium]